MHYSTTLHRLIIYYEDFEGADHESAMYCCVSRTASTFSFICLLLRSLHSFKEASRLKFDRSI